MLFLEGINIFNIKFWECILRLMSLVDQNIKQNKDFF